MNDNPPVWLIIIGVILAFLALSRCQEPSTGENCYDADPTAFHDIVCE